jgi:hypothetical protein
VLLLIPHFLQHELGFAALAAREAAKFIVVRHCLFVCYNLPFIYISFSESNIKN